MKQYEPDTFYQVRHLPREDIVALFHRAKDLCDRWWLDKLDCRVSFARQRVPNATFEEALSHFVPGAMAVVIHRKFYEEYLEVGFRSMENPVDYFLWIIVPMNQSAKITDTLSCTNNQKT